MNLSDYQPTPKDVYQGRDDNEKNARFFQVVKCVNLQKEVLPLKTKPCFAILGFASDAGVIRNQGRGGASLGPYAIRSQLSHLTLHELNKYEFIDVGNIVCKDDNLESAQAELARIITLLLKNQMTPVVLGGGHETAWGHYQGIYAALPETKLGIINFDAHFDMRPCLEKDRGTSGTSFLQIAEHRKKQELNFDYLCLGIQSMANSDALFATAKKFAVNTILAESIHKDEFTRNKKMIKEFMATVDRIYLTFCLDVMAQSVAPGVSAPQALGLFPQQVLPYLKIIMESKKVISFDVVECTPIFDRDHRTEKLAASLCHAILNEW